MIIVMFSCIIGIIQEIVIIIQIIKVKIKILSERIKTPIIFYSQNNKTKCFAILNSRINPLKCLEEFIFNELLLNTFIDKESNNLYSFTVDIPFILYFCNPIKYKVNIIPERILILSFTDKSFFFSPSKKINGI